MNELSAAPSVDVTVSCSAWFDDCPHAAAIAAGAAQAALRDTGGSGQFLVDVTRKRPDSWWREDFRPRFAIVNGLPGIVVDAPEGPVQTAAFEIEGGVVRALYVVRNPDKLRHLARA